MTVAANTAQRQQFLARVVRKECRHLATTDQRLFAGEFTLAQINQLEADIELAERVDAFVGRFGRLQDTVGDKLLPLLLAALGEKPASAIDNLDRAERLGLLDSSDEWMTMRNLKNQMVHEYVEDPVVLTSTLHRPRLCAGTHCGRHQYGYRNRAAGMGVTQGMQLAWQ